MYEEKMCAASRETHRSLLEQQVGSNHEYARELAKRAERLADMLVGATPEDAAGKSAGMSSNGLLDALRSAAYEQRSSLERISTALSRMEKELG